MSHFKWGNPLYSSPVAKDNYYIVVIFYIGSIFQPKLLKSRKKIIANNCMKYILRNIIFKGEAFYKYVLVWWHPELGA